MKEKIRFSLYYRISGECSNPTRTCSSHRLFTSRAVHNPFFNKIQGIFYAEHNYSLTVLAKIQVKFKIVILWRRIIYENGFLVPNLSTQIPHGQYPGTIESDMDARLPPYLLEIAKKKQKESHLPMV